jgi:hypothetical protein
MFRPAVAIIGGFPTPCASTLHVLHVCYTYVLHVMCFIYCDVHTVRQQSTKEGRCLTTSSRATMEATSVFFVVCPNATMGQPYSLCGLFRGSVLFVVCSRAI